MSVKGKEKIFRAAVAALISSPLTARELEDFVHHMDVDRSFRYRLFDVLMHVSKESVSNRRESDEEEVELDGFKSEIFESDGLVDLVVDILKRRRVPRRDLRSLLLSLNPQFVEGLDEGLSLRDLVELFLNFSTARQRKGFLRELGIEAEDDLYLGGIADRSRGLAG